MDPVSAIGLVSSVAQLADFTGIFLLKLYRYYVDVSEASKSADELRSQVGLSLSLLNALHQVLPTSLLSPNEYSLLENSLISARRILEKYDEEVKPENTKGRRKWSWPFRKEQIYKLVSALQERNATFQLALNLVQKKTTDHLVDVVGELAEIQKARSLLEDIRTENKILSWLSPIDVQSDQHTYESLRTDGTGIWIFEDARYESWFTSRGSSLWLHGHMGIGKTILASSIITELSSQRIRDPNIHLAYFFCNGSIIGKQDARYIIGSILRQLLAQISPETRSRPMTMAASLYESDVYKGNNYRVRDLDEALASILDHILGTSTTFYVFVDGLDEITHANATRLLHILKRLGRSTSLNLLVTSRSEMDVKAMFSREGVSEFCVSAEAVQRDICCYVKWQLDNAPGLCKVKSQGLRRDIERTLLERSGGMFRWVQCQLDYIKSLKCNAERREALVSLPPGLPDTYQRILNPIVKPDIVVATKALRWLVCTQRPLALSELAVAIAIEPGTSRFNEEKKLDDDEMILTILGSLVRQNAETAAVEVAHFSVVEYLTSASFPDGALNRYYIDQEEGHTELLHCCLTHLSFDHADDESVVNPGQHSFLSYAIFQWPLHAKRAEQNGKAIALTKTFLSSPESLVFRRWRAYWEAGFDPNLRVNLAETHSGLYYAALFGLPRVVESFLQSPDAITDAGGIALLAAARDGNEEVIDLLINANVDPTGSTRTALGWTALHRAVYNAHENFVRKLLATQIDVDVQDADGWTALHIAISEGYGDLTQLLLTNGANPSVQVYESGWGPLHFAAQHGMIDILKVLLEAGADVMQLTKNGSTPLQITVLHEQPHAFDFLTSQIKSGASWQFPDEHQSPDGITTAFERCKEELNENQGDDRRIPRLSTSASGTASGTSKI